MPLTILPHMISRKSPVTGMDPEEFSDIVEFRERAEKLASAQRKYQRIPISKTSRTQHTGEIAFEANTPDIEEIGSLARNFRFFYADKEPTQFQKILKKVRRRTKDEWAGGYLEWIAERYKEVMKSSQVSAGLGHPVSNRRIIDLWLNSELFHSEKLKREELSKIQDIIGKEAPLFQLYVAIAHCSSYIHMLYSVVHLLDPKHQFIYSPNHHFGSDKQVGDSDL